MYPDALQAAVNQLIAKVHGHETISGFRPAKLYTGRHWKLFLQITRKKCQPRSTKVLSEFIDLLLIMCWRYVSVIFGLIITHVH